MLLGYCILRKAMGRLVMPLVTPNIHTFESVNEFIAACNWDKYARETIWLSHYLPTLATMSPSVYSSDPAIRLSERWGRALNVLRTVANDGDPALIAETEKLMEKIESQTKEVSAFTQSRDVFGPRLSMGEWLAGSPTCFRRRKRTMQEAQPLSIYVGMFASASFSDSILLKRGQAILALVAKLQVIRPVDLWLVCESHATLGEHSPRMLKVKVDTRPFNLAQASFVLGNPMFFRTLMFTYMYRQMGVDRCIPAPYTTSDITAQKQFAELAGANESDLYLPSIASSTGRDIVNDPVNWVNAYLAQYSTGEVAEQFELGETW